MIKNNRSDLIKNIERGSIKHLVVLTLACAICGVILYPIFDLLLCKFITNSKFVYSVHEYVIQPVLFGCIFSTILWLMEKK